MKNSTPSTKFLPVTERKLSYPIIAEVGLSRRVNRLYLIATEQGPAVSDGKEIHHPSQWAKIGKGSFEETIKELELWFAKKTIWKPLVTITETTPAENRITIPISSGESEPFRVLWTHPKKNIHLIAHPRGPRTTDGSTIDEDEDLSQSFLKPEINELILDRILWFQSFDYWKTLIHKIKPIIKEPDQEPTPEQPPEPVPEQPDPCEQIPTLTAANNLIEQQSFLISRQNETIEALVKRNVLLVGSLNEAEEENQRLTKLAKKIRKRGFFADLPAFLYRIAYGEPRDQAPPRTRN